MQPELKRFEKDHSQMRKLALCTAVAAITALSSLHALASAETDAVSQKIREKTGMIPEGVRKMPVAGLYEIIVRRQIFYTDAEGKYLIAGRIFDTTQNTDITAARLEELNRIDWKVFRLEDAVKVVRGKGERKVVVFTDARCPYCSMLERNLQKIDNITVYNFIYPILNSGSISRNIFCSENPVAAFEAHMLEGKDPAEFAEGKCDYSALERNLALGRELGITGTPTIIFQDGSRVSGALSPDQIEARLSAK